MNHDNGFKRLLRTILMYDASEDSTTVKAVAPLLGVSEAMVYRYCRATDAVQMPYEKARALSRYLIAEYGDRRIADYFNGDGVQHCTNGMIDDEIVDLDLIEGRIIEAFRAGDYDGARALVLKGDDVFARLKKEIEEAHND